jgi:hypothetical protein
MKLIILFLVLNNISTSKTHLFGHDFPNVKLNDRCSFGLFKVTLTEETIFFCKEKKKEDIPQLMPEEEIKTKSKSAPEGAIATLTESVRKVFSQRQLGFKPSKGHSRKVSTSAPTVLNKTKQEESNRYLLSGLYYKRKDDCYYGDRMNNEDVLIVQLFYDYFYVTWDSPKRSSESNEYWFQINVSVEQLEKSSIPYLSLEDLVKVEQPVIIDPWHFTYRKLIFKSHFIASKNIIKYSVGNTESNGELQRFGFTTDEESKAEGFVYFDVPVEHAHKPDATFNKNTEYFNKAIVKQYNEHFLGQSLSNLFEATKEFSFSYVDLFETPENNSNKIRYKRYVLSKNKYELWYKLIEDEYFFGMVVGGLKVTFDIPYHHENEIRYIPMNYINDS